MNGKRFGRALGLGAGVVALSATVLGGTAGASTSVGTIAMGSGNTKGVRCVQQAINNMHKYHTKWYHYVAEDGVFGSDTYNGVKSFQHFINYYEGTNLARDGIVGRQTGSWIIIWSDDKYQCNTHVPTKA